MVTIESTPNIVSSVYESMARNLRVVRRRLKRPLTLAEKALFGHLDDPHSQSLEVARSYLSLRPDRVVFQDVLGQTGMLQFMQTHRDSIAVPATIHCDHLIQARTEGSQDLIDGIEENAEVFDFLRSAAARYGLGFWGPGAGIMHQVVLENYAFPGELIIGTDSHTPNAGGLGACGVGVGGADAVEVLAGMPWELLYPRRIAVYLDGNLNGWAAPKDVILYVAGELSVSGATNAIVEYIGPGARTLSATGKATITNMGAELGATSSLFPVDEHMTDYLAATGRANLAPLVWHFKHLLEPDPEVEAEPESFYDRVVRLNLSRLEPHVVGPHSPDRARPISALAAEIADGRNGFVDEVSAALIGSCTNSSYEDMSRAAAVAKQARDHGVVTRVPFMVTPGSELVRRTIERDGQLKALTDVGAVVLANACGPCIGQWRRAAGPDAAPNTIVTSYNRNFPRRNDGAATTMNFIASPEIVTALSIAGRLSFNPLTDTLTDSAGKPFRFEPPGPAPEVPLKGFQPGTSAYTAPPVDGANVTVQVKAGSERLQVMQPWPEWDGMDFVGLPVLLKSQGKTTTDHISPAGSWLRYRGNLDRFSDNMFSGAHNVFTEVPGHGIDVLTGDVGLPLAQIARHYKAAGLRWVVIGDENYGEGSSREHAALSPRLLGGVAVIARSFARIHESNLKKQGLLPLTFVDPADYDAIGPYDRISLTGLARMKPDAPVSCRIEHADGTGQGIWLRHSFSAHQLEWFRKGSALNQFR